MTNKRFSQKALKSYSDPDFMNSEEARVLRIIAEYMGPHKQFKEEEISNTIVMFGSARIRSLEQCRSRKRSRYGFDGMGTAYTTMSC